MKAIKVYESLNNILKPKEIEDIRIDPIAQDLINDCYEIIANYPYRFAITAEPGINYDRFERWYYGFEFMGLDENKDRFTLEFDGEKGAVVSVHNSEYYADDIKSVDDFMFQFNLYEPVTESLEDVLKPKSQEELDVILNPKTKQFIQDAYNTIKWNKKFRIIQAPPGTGWELPSPGYFSGEGVSGYGFQFETTEPLTKDDITNEYHIGEIGEFTLGFFPGNVQLGVYIIFENSGHDMEINNLDELKMYLNIDETTNESIFQPKSEDDLKAQFEKDNPKFTKIFYEMFPENEYNLERGEEGVEGSFAFTETDKSGDEHLFLVKQSKYEKNNPVISHLNKSRVEGGMAVFSGGNHVLNVDEIKYYVNKFI